MRYRLSLSIFLLMFLVAFSALPGFNITLDVAGVFRKDYAHQYKGRTPNERYLQIKYVQKHKNKFNSFFIGSSRVGNSIDLIDIDGWYKLWYQGGIIPEHVHHIRALAAIGVDIEHVVMEVNYFDLLKDNRDEDYFAQDYPIGFIEKVKFFKFYLFRPVTALEREIITGKRPKVYKRPHIFSNVASPHKNENLEKLRNSYHLKGSNNTNIDRITSGLATFIQFGESHPGTKLVLYYPPHHYKNILAHDPVATVAMKREMSRLMPFWDFSFPSEILFDNKNWRDVSHFDVTIGTLIVDRIIYDKDGGIGRLISPDTVEEFLASYYETIVGMIPELLRRDTKTLLHGSYFAETVCKNIDGFRVKRETLPSGENYDITPVSPWQTPSETLIVRITVNTSVPTHVKIIYTDRDGNHAWIDGSPLIADSGIWPPVPKEQTFLFPLSAQTFGQGFELKFDNSVKITNIDTMALKQDHQWILDDSQAR